MTNRGSSKSRISPLEWVTTPAPDASHALMHPGTANRAPAGFIDIVYSFIAALLSNATRPRDGKRPKSSALNLSDEAMPSFPPDFLSRTSGKRQTRTGDVIAAGRVRTLGHFFRRFAGRTHFRAGRLDADSGHCNDHPHFCHAASAYFLCDSLVSEPGSLVWLWSLLSARRIPSPCPAARSFAIHVWRVDRSVGQNVAHPQQVETNRVSKAANPTIEPQPAIYLLKSDRGHRVYTEIEDRFLPQGDSPRAMNGAPQRPRSR